MFEINSNNNNSHTKVWMRLLNVNENAHIKVNNKAATNTRCCKWWECAHSHNELGFRTAEERKLQIAAQQKRRNKVYFINWTIVYLKVFFSLFNFSSIFARYLLCAAVMSLHCQRRRRRCSLSWAPNKMFEYYYYTLLTHQKKVFFSLSTNNWRWWCWKEMSKKLSNS